MTVEQKMTAALCIVAFFYSNPSMIFMDFSPSPLLQKINIGVRDFAYSYLAFYMIGIFGFFDREPSPIVSLIVPFMFFGCILVIFTQQDLPYWQSRFFPAHFEPVPSLQSYHYIAFIVTFLYFIINLGSAYGTAKKCQLVRFRFYAIATVSASALLGAYLALRFFVGGRCDEALALPMGLFAAFALVMECAHESAGDGLVVPGYVAPGGDEEGGGANPIGIDEDPQSLEQKAILAGLQDE